MDSIRLKRFSGCSCLPWFEVFYHLLNLLAEMINRSEDNDVTDLLRATYANGVPDANVSTTIVAGQEVGQNCHWAQRSLSLM